MKKLRLLLVAALTGLAFPAAATVVNVSPGTIAVVSQSSTLSGYPANNALNRNYGDFTHTAAEATDNWWLVDLGGPVPVTHVVLFNRTSCCGDRLRDITIGFYDTNNVLITSSPMLNPGNVMGSPPSLAFTNATPVSARYVKVTRKATGPAGDHNANTLSLAEVEIHANNLASGRPATQSSTYGASYGPEKAVNGNPADFTHTSAEPTDNWWQVDLGADYEVDSVLLLNRGDGCCPERLRDITVSVLDASQVPVYMSPLLNPGNALAGPKSLGVDIRFLNGAPVLGRYVRVSRLATGPAGDHNANVLALGEVQVYGAVPSGVPPGISVPPWDQVGVVGGTATFSVGAVGTEPLFYQWIKDGTNVLANQTNAVLTLTNLTLADAGSYAVTVTNAFGSSNSSSATLTMFVWNAARFGTASQSTEANGGAPSRAIDGNTNGNWASGSVTHTGNTPIDNEWWEVDLGAPVYVDRVHLWFRTDCCQSRNENLRLVIYDSADPGARQVVWTQNVGPNPGSNKAFNLSPAVLGQVVRVEHPPGIADVLSLAEVQVYEGPHGQSLLWVGGNPDNSWDATNTFNWDAGSGPEVFHPRDTVTFDNSSAETSVNLVGTLAPMVVNVAGDQTYVFQGVGRVVGNNLVKIGDGTLVLANAATNKFSLGTLVSQGTLQIGNGGTTGTLPAGPLTNNAVVAFDRSDDLTVSSGMTGTGVVRKQGANTLTLAGANSQTGGTVVSAGTLRVQNNAALGNAATALITVSHGATLDLSAYELWNYAQPIVINGSGVGGVGAITKSATGNQNGLALRSITLGSDASIGGVPGARIDIGRGDWPWPPVPMAPIHIDGQGHTLSLVGNIYLGILAGAQNLPEILVNGGTLVAPHGDNSFGNATVTLNGGTLAPWGWGRVFANPLVVHSGFIENQGFTNTYTGPVQLHGPLEVNAVAGGTITFAGAITGAGSVTKIGADVLILSGANAYTGGTVVSNGTLRYDGSLAGGAGPVTVAGGTLSGNGTINAAVEVQAGGTLAPGASVGVLTIGGPLTLAGQTFIEINKAALTNDAVRGLSALTYGGVLVVTNLDGALAAGDRFTLFESASYSGAFASTQVPDLPPGLNWDLSQLAVNGTLSVNQSPVAADTALTTTRNQSVALAIVKVLERCSDPDGDSLSVVSVSASTNGAVVTLGGGHITYTPVTDFIGVDRFGFTITDGRGGEATGAVQVLVSSDEVPSLNIVSVQRVGDDFRFTFAGIPGRTYQIERALQVTGPWTNVGSRLAGPTGLGTFVDTNSPPGSAYYRTVYP